jgi:2-hydroxychromene-2-carboxylate isomerase
MRYSLLAASGPGAGFKNQASFSDEALRAAAATMDMDPAALLAAMDDPATLAAAKANAAAGNEAGLQNSPLMAINGKVVPRWLHGEQPMLRPILEAAAKGN